MPGLPRFLDVYYHTTLQYNTNCTDTYQNVSLLTTAKSGEIFPIRIHKVVVPSLSPDVQN